MTVGVLRNLLPCLIAVAGLALPASAQDTNAPAAATAATEEAAILPRFRHIDVGGKPASFVRESIILLIDEDFPPFSYAGPEGEPKGIAVDAAEAACQELRTKCQIVLTSWEALSGDLNGVSNVVAGLRVDDKALARFQPTRPIYRAVGRFAVRKESDITQVTPELLAAKRIGVIEGSGYEAWLKKNFADAVIVPYPSLSELQEALRTAKVEVLFGDGLQLVYWMRGGASQECCKYIEGGYFDDASFSRPYVFLIRRGDEELRQAFDYALDQLQETGAFAKIFARYVPGRFW
ncbi:transporter substrate-binding domain-containing protein [Taklimakanibacter lacteus]|uniref:transporter substrate-binding domain-containing protein n=1 Tax=Taklimakanibacter lacteus TaxID=2268456 RepID=UPI000E661CEE